MKNIIITHRDYCKPGAHATALLAPLRVEWGDSTWLFASTLPSPTEGRWNVLNCFELSDG